MFGKAIFGLVLLLPLGLSINTDLVRRYDSCPTVTVSCPEDICGCGPDYRFVAQISGADPAVLPTYKWTVSAGKIVEGQNTYRIRVDTSGVKTSDLTANVEIGGWDEACPNKASVTILWSALASPPNKSFEPTAGQR